MLGGVTGERKIETVSKFKGQLFSTAAKLNASLNNNHPLLAGWAGQGRGRNWGMRREALEGVCEGRRKPFVQPKTKRKVIFSADQSKFAKQGSMV
jgi:hypothetical protein